MTVTATVTLIDNQGNIVASETTSFGVTGTPGSITTNVATTLVPGRVKRR